MGHGETTSTHEDEKKFQTIYADDSDVVAAQWDTLKTWRYRSPVMAGAPPLVGMSAPVVQATIACGTMSGTVQLGSPLARIDPPSAFFTLDPDLNAAHPAYTLTLAARLRESADPNVTVTLGPSGW